MEAELLGPGNWHCPFLLKPSRAPTLSSKAARLQGSLETDVCCFLIIHPWELVCQLLQIGRNPYTSSSASFPFKPTKGTTQHILKQMGYDETTTNQSQPTNLLPLTCALWRFGARSRQKPPPGSGGCRRCTAIPIAVAPPGARTPRKHLARFYRARLDKEAEACRRSSCDCL